MPFVDWDRRAPGGVLAVAGYAVLVVGVIFAFWLSSRALEDVEETKQRVDYQICVEQNRMREAIIEVQRGRQPLPVPEDASIRLQQSIQAYNDRQAQHIERFEDRMKLLDCEKVR